ncbi:ABC transporter ATP-binding protein [Pirellulaceae bacterium SH449]
MIKPNGGPTPSEFVLEVDNLTKHYSGKIACDRVSLHIRPGTTFGLLGPNGAGKSTLIRMLMGLTPFDSGAISLFGEERRLSSPEMRQRVGYVPELHYIYRWMTISKVMNFASRLYRRWDSDLAQEMLSKFALLREQRVGTLSKGMMAKLGLVIALAHNPDFLILDEPASGLDPIIREDFLESVLQNHTCRGRTILFSSHHVDDVERVADEVGIMVGGRLVIRGSVDELRSRVKRIRMVLRDGRLPVHIPAGVYSQRLVRRDWIVTVQSFSEELVDELRTYNDAIHYEVMDLNLEEIFKDVVRGNLVTEGGEK